MPRVTRWPGVARPPALDLALAAVLTVLTQAELWSGTRVAGPLWAQALCFAVATGAVAARRSAPLVAASVVAPALTAQTVLLGDAPVVGGFVAALVCTYSVAAQLALRPALVGAGVVAVALAAEPIADPTTRTLGDAVGNGVVFGTVWGLGWLVRTLRLRGNQLEERASTAEAWADEEAHRAVVAERERIARELHDVVAHGVSLMVLQAGAARQLLDPGHRACGPLLTVEETGRQALEEMHRMLLVLRHSDEGDRAPLATLDQLGTLLAQVRSAGLDVDLTTDGHPRSLPAGVELTAYRIVQEALTNVLKHAGRARAHVRLAYGQTELVVEVTDDGAGAPARVEGLGHGLVGLRERAALYGGQLTAGSRPDGGFAVAATLPLAVHRSVR